MEWVLRIADRPSRVLGTGLAVSAALLIGAHLFERVGGLLPCDLCLDQREAHWAALGLAGASLIAMRFFSAVSIGRAAVGALALVFGFSAALAGYHAGIEWGWWPGPATCGGAAAASLDPGAIESILSGEGAPISCEKAQWRLFGISMAGYNALASAALFGLCAIALERFSRRETTW